MWGSGRCGRWICGGGGSRLRIWGLWDMSVSRLHNVVISSRIWWVRTIRIELQDLQIHVGVCDNEVELLVKGQEFHRDGF